MGFDTALKRYFAGLVLALIAIAAYFQASGITQLVGAALAPDPKALAAANAAGARAPAPRCRVPRTITPRAPAGFSIAIRSTR